MAQVDLEFEYRLLVFSCYGRVHLEGKAILKILAQVAARRRGVFNYEVLLARAHRNIGVEIWRKLVLIVNSCMPRLTAGENQLLHGEFVVRLMALLMMTLLIMVLLERAH